LLGGKDGITRRASGNLVPGIPCNGIFSKCACSDGKIKKESKINPVHLLLRLFEKDSLFSRIHIFRLTVYTKIIIGVDKFLIFKIKLYFVFSLTKQLLLMHYLVEVEPACSQHSSDKDLII
jgi:hypothetical protein